MKSDSFVVHSYRSALHSLHLFSFLCGKLIWGYSFTPIVKQTLW